MKRFISVFCTIALIIGITPSNILAFNIEQTKSTSERILEEYELLDTCTSQLVSTVDNDLKSLSFLGIQDEKLSISKIDVNDVISYSYQITNDTTDIYQVTQSIDGSVVVDVTEGKLHDQIVKQADGTVWVNGVNYGAATQRMLNTYYSRTAMGSVASYVKYLGPTSNADVALSKSIVSFTITAFCTILASCYGLPSSFADLMSNLSQRVLSAANAGNPTSKSLSYKQYKYERSDSIGTDRYYRYIADCYPEANFNGSVSQEIYYQHTYFT